MLDAIARGGSISAAARAMKMSYRRAWWLVDMMNRHFRDPLVRGASGGAQGGGAHVTEAGFVVLARFRAMKAAAMAAVADGLAACALLLRADPD